MRKKEKAERLKIEAIKEDADNGRVEDLKLRLYGIYSYWQLILEMYHGNKWVKYN